MTSDARVQQAREHHRALTDLGKDLEQHREIRNQLIRQLRAEAPDRWTYRALAKAVGCSPELVAAILQGRI